MARYIMVLSCATSLLGALVGVSPENLDFLGPNGTRFARCHFRAQKSLDFQGPPLVMILHASKPLRTAPYKQQVH